MLALPETYNATSITSIPLNTVHMIHSAVGTGWMALLAAVINTVITDTVIIWSALLATGHAPVIPHTNSVIPTVAVGIQLFLVQTGSSAYQEPDYVILPVVEEQIFVRHKLTIAMLQTGAGTTTIVPGMLIVPLQTIIPQHIAAAATSFFVTQAVTNGIRITKHLWFADRVMFFMTLIPLIATVQSIMALPGMDARWCAPALLR